MASQKGKQSDQKPSDSILHKSFMTGLKMLAFT